MTTLLRDSCSDAVGMAVRMSSKIRAEPEYVVQVGFLLHSGAQGSKTGVARRGIPARFYAPHPMSVVGRGKRIMGTLQHTFNPDYNQKNLWLFDIRRTCLRSRDFGNG